MQVSSIALGYTTHAHESGKLFIVKHVNAAGAIVGHKTGRFQKHMNHGGTLSVYLRLFSGKVAFKNEMYVLHMFCHLAAIQITGVSV